MMKKVYIASSYKFVEKCQVLADTLEKKFGIGVTRRWWKFLFADYDDFKDMTDREYYSHPQVQFVSELDFKGIRDADLVILITDNYHHIGAFIECGYAHALGKIILVFGQIKRSAMCAPFIHVEDEKQLFRLLERIAD